MTADNKKRAIQRLKNIDTLIGLAIDDLEGDDFEAAFNSIEEMRSNLDLASRIVEAAC